MPKKDPRIDAYIKKSAPFARPILEHLRAVAHEACPEAEETLKWGMPAFTHHGNLFIMGSFTKHCGLWFWKPGLVFESKAKPATKALGQFGRITAIADLPSKRLLVGYVKKAAALNEAGVPKRPARAKAAAKKAAKSAPKRASKPAAKAAAKPAVRAKRAPRAPRRRGA